MSYTLPRLDTSPAKKKQQKYHEDFARAIINRSVDDSWRNSWLLMSECYKFLEDGSNGELVAHLQKAEDGTDLPAIWLSLNSIPTKIELLTGELETRGYEINVRAISKDAQVRKIDEKNRLRVKRRLQPLFNEADKAANIPVGESEYIPQTEQELDEYADLGWKDTFVLIMSKAMNWLVKRNNFTEERKTLLRDVLASGRVFSRNDIVRGLPVSSRVHPLNMIWDTSSKKDDLSDATFFGELDYKPLAAAAEQFNLSTTELESVYNAYQSHMGTTPATDGVNPSSEYTHSFNTISGNRLSWFKTVDGELRVLVAKAVWRDFDVLSHKNETNPKYATEHLQEVDIEKVRERDKSKLITKKIEVWRQCTIIGGHIIRDWGLCPNQPRDITDIAPTLPPYQAWVPNFSTGRGVSKVEQLASIQLYKDILMYNMQLAVVRSGARGLSYDLAMKPDTMTIEQVMKYLKTFGMTFYNSKDFQNPYGNPTAPFKEFDMSLSDSVTKYVEMMNYLDRQMEVISGISPERQGVVQGASQGLGVTQAALFQNNLITQPLFVGFERFCSRIMSHQARLVKIAWANKEVFAPIIGDAGINFLQENIDLDLEDFSVVVESVPPMLQDRAKFEQLVMLVVQSDPTFIDEAIQILMEPDLKTGIRRFTRRRILRQIFQAKQAEIQEQRQAALEERLAQIEASQQDKEIQGRLQETDMKNEAGIFKTQATGKTKLASDNIKLMAEMLKNKNQQNNDSER